MLGGAMSTTQEPETGGVSKPLLIEPGIHLVQSGPQSFQGIVLSDRAVDVTPLSSILRWIVMAWTSFTLEIMRVKDSSEQSSSEVSIETTNTSTSGSWHQFWFWRYDTFRDRHRDGWEILMSTGSGSSRYMWPRSERYIRQYSSMPELVAMGFLSKNVNDATGVTFFTSKLEGWPGIDWTYIKCGTSFPVKYLKNCRWAFLVEHYAKLITHRFNFTILIKVFEIYFYKSTSCEWMRRIIAQWSKMNLP